MTDADGKTERQVESRSWCRSCLSRSMPTMGLRGICLAAIGSLIASQAYSSPILDQQNTVLSSTLNGGSSAYEWEQGITAGLAGQLTEIDVFAVIDPALGTPSTTELFVNLGAPWQSDANEWSTITTLTDGWNSFDVTGANIFLNAGSQFVIGFRGQGGTTFNPGLGFSYGDLYGDGGLFLNGVPDVPTNDLDFRTYVTAVPEPSPILLLVTGILYRSTWLRRKYRVEAVGDFCGVLPRQRCPATAAHVTKAASVDFRKRS